MSTFTDWLLAELAHRGWNRSELARRADLSVSSISMILSDQRSANADTCVKLADALGLSPELVLRRAGYLPEQGSDVPEGHQPRTAAELAAFQLYQRLKELPPDDQKLVFDLMKRLRGDRGVSEAGHVPVDADS